MSRKIIGATVGSPLPKPDLMQNDPKKGDYVKGKEEFLEQIPGGGSSDFLVVKIDFGTNTASHSASEITEAVNAGKVIITTDDYGALVPIYYCDGEVATFLMIGPAGNDLYVTEILIGEDKNAVIQTEFRELNGASVDETEIVNSVLAALPTWTGGSY